MGAIDTLKFGLSIAGVFSGVLIVGFWAYFTLLGRNKKNHP